MVVEPRAWRGALLVAKERKSGADSRAQRMPLPPAASRATHGSSSLISLLGAARRAPGKGPGASAANWSRQSVSAPPPQTPIPLRLDPPGQRAKAAARLIARQVVAECGVGAASRHEGPFNTDAAEAVLLGYYAVLELGWLHRSPPVRRFQNGDVVLPRAASPPPPRGARAALRGRTTT